MNPNTKISAVNGIVNILRQKRILNYINEHPESQAELAKKEYKRFNATTIIIILLVVLPLCFYLCFSLVNMLGNPTYSNGASKRVSGRISLYEDTFWYTDSSHKYEYNFDDYNIDESYEPGENITIYLNENNEVISVEHQAQESNKMIMKIILMLIIPIILLLTHMLVGRKTYAKNWNLYVQWYEKEIEPYLYRDDFKEIVANKRYYDVTNIKDLDVEKQKLYKKYRNRNIVYSILFFAGVVLIIYVYVKFEIDFYSWIGVGIIFAYVIGFFILMSICDEKMQRIKSEYHSKK